MRLIQAMSKTTISSVLSSFSVACILILGWPGAHAAVARQTEKASVKTKKTVAATPKKVVVAGRKKVTVQQNAVRLTAKRGRDSKKTVTPVAVAVPAKPSYGQMAGLHAAVDPLELKSSVALVIDQDTHEILLSKNDHAILPIASLTKLMTGMILVQAKLPMDELVTITQDDVDTEKKSRSRLKVGTALSREELLHLALMSSENRAANALGRTFPGGMDTFVAKMNDQAKLLGMRDTHYVEPTGLSSDNQSSAHDLAILVGAAYKNSLLRSLTTSPSHEVEVDKRTILFNNTNLLVKNPDWNIGLQKTGYITEAGRCLVMQASIAGRKLIMVFLDSAGKLSRIGDAQRVRSWVESNSNVAILNAR